MGGAFLHKQGQFLYFLLLILSIPAAEKHADPPKLQERQKFLCQRSDLAEHVTTPLIVETLVADYLLAPFKLNQTSSKTRWAFSVDTERRQQDVTNTWVCDLTSDLLMPSESGPWSERQNNSRLPHILLHSAAERECKDGTCSLFVDFYSKSRMADSTRHNESIQGRCSLSANHQNSIVAEEVLPETFKVPIHPAKITQLEAFHMYNQCPWPHESYTSSEVLSVFDDSKAVQSLEMDFNSSWFPSLEHYSLKERISKLLDDRNAKYACSQSILQEFDAKNMRKWPLHVHSLVIKGKESNAHGFKLEHFGDFYLEPGQTTRFQISYHPDFKAGISDGELQLLTSKGMFTVTLKAKIPKHIQSFCRNAALMEIFKKISLQVCSLALFLVLLLFGRMLRQEGLVMSDESQWPTATNAVKIPQRASGRSMHYHDGKRSSIYLSIDIGCSHDEGKQYCRSLAKAVDVLHSAISCIVGFKLLHISHTPCTQQPVMSITRESDLFTQHNNEITSTTSSITGKHRASSHVRASRKAACTNFTRGALPLKTNECSTKRTVSPLEVANHSPKTEPESPSTGHSDKENEKTKQKKKKKGAPFIASGVETGSDGASTSLSMPSSPMKGEFFIPLSPSSLSSDAFDCKASSEVEEAAQAILEDIGIQRMSDNDLSSKRDTSIAHDVLWSKPKNDFSSEDLEANKLYSPIAKLSPKNIEQESKHSGTVPVIAPHEINLVKVATVRSSTKGNVATRSRPATLTASATFPAPGWRQFHGPVPEVKEDGQNPLIWSSSSDLASTSPVAPHARAPGSPLSPKTSPCRRQSLLSSPSIKQNGNHETSHRLFHGNPAWHRRNGCRGDLKGRFHYTQEMFYHSESEGNSPRKMHYPQKKHDLHGSDCTSSYNIWGDRFADLGRRYGSYWIGKDIPIRRKASPLPPLLQTPPFSVFSSNDPFNK